jgi:predicted PurR-regulated permease PerM
MIEAIRNKSQWVSGILFFFLLAALIFINAPFLMPFLIAGIFAMGLDDFITRTASSWKVKRWVIIALVIFIGFALFWAPLSLATYRLVNIFKSQNNLNATQISSQLESLKNYAMELVHKISAITGADISGPVHDSLDTVIKKIGELIISFSSAIISSAPTIIFNALIFTIFFISFSANASKLKSFILKYSVLKESVTETIIYSLQETCSVTLFSTFVVGVIQAGIVVLGSLIFNEGDFWFIMPLTFFVAFIPVIGAGPVGFTLAVIAFIGGRTGSGIGMLIFSTVASTIDNVLKPLLIGGKDLKPSPVLTFTCVVGSIITLGIPGILMGPMIMNVFIRVAPILIKEYNSAEQYGLK